MSVDVGDRTAPDRSGPPAASDARFSIPHIAAPHVAILDVDLADGLEATPGVDAFGAPWTAAQVLVRMFTEPIGALNLPLSGEGLGAEQLALAISSELEDEVRSRMISCGLPWAGRVPADGLHPLRTPPFLESRERVLAQAPSLTVAICTRGRPEGLSRLLSSLHAQDYPSLRVLVVDNAPLDDRARRVVGEHSSQLDVSYVVEPRPGLSHARNRSIEASEGEIIAWVDDDEVCDRWWAAELARGFVEHPGADAVSGMILPAEIDTPAQLWFERYGGHSKGRGFTPEAFSPASRHAQSPLYPLPPFGTGACMAFRRGAIERIGRFDPALGAGTPTLAGEDAAAFSTLLFLGGTVVWQPTALVSHWHRREHGELLKLFHGYGRGLGAFYASMIARHPESVGELVLLIPRALRDLSAPDGPRLGGIGEDFPRDLLRTRRSGLLQGPAMYIRARLAGGRVRPKDAR
jgi:glycosyltransferase involved in cell wall biosynthesis